MYQIDKPKVFLSDEIDHLKDYVALEKMRFHDTLSVDMEVDVENRNELIAPMLLIPFVENSFKHGSIIDGQLYIKIKIVSLQGALKFMVSNYSSPIHGKSVGIGLENLKKRLEIAYKNNHSLNIYHENNSFNVSLEIFNLNEA